MNFVSGLGVDCLVYDGLVFLGVELSYDVLFNVGEMGLMMIIVLE